MPTQSTFTLILWVEISWLVPLGCWWLVVWKFSRRHLQDKHDQNWETSTEQIKLLYQACRHDLTEAWSKLRQQVGEQVGLLPPSRRNYLIAAAY